MSGIENHYDETSNPVTSFSTHDQIPSQLSKTLPTFRSTEYAKTTTLPPFSTMMPTSFSTTSQSTKFSYDKENPFTEPRHYPQHISSHSQQSFDPSVDPISTSISSEKHFYRSAVRSSELPNPLPVPPYSQELITARECGRAGDYRSMVIRETVKYFLKMKYWWTSEDYDCMARMVAKEFPDLRDPNVAAGQPDYVRIRAHLSQTARNLRRVAKNQQHRKLMTKSEPGVATTSSHSNVETEQDSLPLPIVHNMKQESSSNRTALPSVAHILSKQYLSPSPMSYPMNTASLLPQMMSAGSILASPTYQKFLHSSLLAMSPGGMSALSQKLLSQLAAGTYQALPAFGHNPSFGCPVKVEPDSDLNEYGLLASYAASKMDSYSDDSDHQQEQDSPEANTRDRGHHDSQPLPDHFSSTQDPNRESTQDAENQRRIAASHHRNVSPARSSSDSILKEMHQKGQSECEDGIKSPTSGLSDESELPNPLPIPKFSERVLTANEMGMTKDMRSTIIRETTTFFLNIKYRWTSSDYDRISSMVVSLFPALRDPISSPGYAPTRRVRSDLSMCARNIRRRDVNKITTGYARKKSRAAVSNFTHDSKVGLNIKAEPSFSQYSELGHTFWDQQAQAHSAHEQTHDLHGLTHNAHGQIHDNHGQTYNAHGQSHNFLEQTHDVHEQSNDTRGQTCDTHGQTYNTHDAHRQTNETREKQFENVPVRESAHCYTYPSSHSEPREAVEVKTGQKDDNSTSASVDLSLPRHPYSSNAEDLRKENSLILAEDKIMDCSNGSFKQDLCRSGDASLQIQNKEGSVFESVPKTVQSPFQNHRDMSETAIFVPNTEHVTSLSDETVGSSCLGSSAGSNIGSYSVSNTHKSLETIDASVHTDLNYEHLTSVHRVNEPALVKANRISSSGCFDSSNRLALESSNNLIPSSSSVLNARPVDGDTNQKYEAGNFNTEVDVNLGNNTTSNKHTGNMDENTSRCDGSGSSLYGSDSAMMFTPLSVRDLRTGADAEGQGEMTGKSSSSVCTTQTSSLAEEMLNAAESSQRQHMATNEACEKAGDWMMRTDSVLPPLQRNVGSSKLPTDSNIRLPKSSSPCNILPDPLPVPTYSLNVRRHQQLGRALVMKNQVIKETVSFYLQMKSIKWLPTDYSRVAKMILLQFPEFKSVKMLKNMIFFTVRNLSSRRQFFQTGRYLKRKHRWLQHRQKSSTSDNHINQTSLPKIATDASLGGKKAEYDVDMATSQADGNVENTNVHSEFVFKPSNDTETIGMAGASFVSSLNLVPCHRRESTESHPFDQMDKIHEKVVTHHAPQTAMTGVEVEERMDNQKNDLTHPPSQTLGDCEQHGLNSQADVTFTETEALRLQSHPAGESANSLSHPEHTDASNTLQTLQDCDPQDCDPHSKNVPDNLRTSLTRQISLPSPLPVPVYSQQLLDSQQDYTMKHNRLQIIRETVKHFLLVKYWWSSRDYERIAEMVVSQFPGLADQDSKPDFPTYRKVRQELSMCARNLRRRFVWWEQQSNLNDSKTPDDVKEPITKYSDDPGREATPVADQNVRSTEHSFMEVDSVDCASHHAENTAQSSDLQQRQPLENSFQSFGGYRNSVGRRLSPLDHHGVSKASTVAPQSVIKMKKTYVNPDHGNLLQMQLSLLWKEGKYLDADLEVNGNKIQAHKLILLAMCPFLQSTLDQTDTKHRIEISMPENSSVEAVDAFLKYLYDGVIHINTDTVHTLSKIADMMRMQKLYKYCHDFLESWKREQQVQEEEQNVCRLSLRDTDPDSTQGLHYSYQAGTNFFNHGQERPSVDSNGGRQQNFQHHQSNQNFDNIYDTFKQRIPQFQNGSCSNSSSTGSQRDGSLKVDRRISDRIANCYSRRSLLSHTESHSDPMVKQENSDLSGSSVVPRSAAEYKQEMDSSGASEQSVFPQWWPSKT